MWCGTRSTTSIPAASSPATLLGLLVSSRTSSMPERSQHRRGMADSRARRRQSRAGDWRRPCRAPVLQRIGAQLVGKADAAALLAQVEQDPAASLADDPQRLLELRPAIAFQRAEHVAGQAFAVQPDQRRLAAGRADQQRDMLLPVVRRRGRRRSASRGRPSSGSLARATISTSGARFSRAISSAETLGRALRRHRPPTAPAADPPSRARISAASRRLGAIAAAPDGAARTGRGRGRGRDRRARAPSRHRARRARSISTGCDRVGGVALVGELQRRGALAADQQRRAGAPDRRASSSSGVAVSTATNAIGCDAVDRAPAGRARSAAIARRIGASPLKPRSRRSAAHGPTAAPSCGTARAPRCAARWPASSGDAHIWSSRRPRSFFVQSGER